MLLKEEESVKFIGGAGGITATLINSVTSLVKFVYQIGQNLGASIRRKVNKTVC